MQSKKAAMFGLDARIALAIFGALSVISGAALYSAIQQAKVVSLVTTMQEIVKSYEAYYLDTGTALPIIGGIEYDLEDLRINSLSLAGWNGPYASFPAGFMNPPYTNLQLRRYASTSFGGVQGAGQVNPSNCTATDCFLYAMQYGVTAAFADEIDLYIDGTKDRNNGDLRVLVYSNGTAAVVWKRFSLLNIE